MLSAAVKGNEASGDAGPERRHLRSATLIHAALPDGITPAEVLVRFPLFCAGGPAPFKTDHIRVDGVILRIKTCRKA